MVFRAGWAAGLIVLCLEFGGEARCQAQSIGCYRMPSTPSQYLGYCYGAGHHAPMVWTPGQHPQHVQRVAVAPGRCGALQPAPYEIMSCYNGHCSAPAGTGAAPGSSVPDLAPVPPPMPTPAEALVQPGYRLARY